MRIGTSDVPMLASRTRFWVVAIMVHVRMSAGRVLILLAWQGWCVGSPGLITWRGLILLWTSRVKDAGTG
ncbi:MAG: hypothetical protein LBN10_03025 [Propionibacteriaceae bacterium]|nr:hypothetical protein [Propionibacteriaceae bacterium]